MLVNWTPVLRELNRRINEYEARVGGIGEEIRGTTIPSMIMNMCDETTALHFRKEGVTRDLTGMRCEVEVLRNLHRTRRAATPLALRSLEEPNNDQWTPEEWN